MVDRIAIAKRYVQEQLEKRDDIIAALLGGSVARGEDTEASDIDLSFVAAETSPTDVSVAQSPRGGMDAWRDGVYIESSIRSQTLYSDLEKVLSDPYLATRMNNALILYDPTGFFNELQGKVRAEFMKPKWMAVRLNHFVDKGQQALTQLQQAVEDQDALSLCYLGGFTFYLIAVSLLHSGVTPSSSRGLSQLGTVAPALHAQICELQGSTTMQPQDVLTLVPICTALTAFVDQASWGQLPEYFTKKATWMAQNGQHREALSAMWLMNSAGAHDCRQSNDPQQISQATQTAEAWLRGVAWEGKANQSAKLELATSLLEQVKALAATV